MKIYKYLLAFVLLLLPLSCFSYDWRDRMDSVTYSPRYFGPNAFPIPEVLSGKISTEYEIEARYDYHDGEGDQTQDIFLRGYFPFGKKAAIEISGVLQETYKTSKEVMDERHAASTETIEGATTCRGDVIINATYQLLENEKIMDIIGRFGLKTASGNWLANARYTDAANYWLDLDIGKDLLRSEKRDKYLRMSIMGGFYCYMTNDRVHRQNDAWLLGGGFQGRYRNVYAEADISGFEGYMNNGDEPLIFRSKLKYRYKGHSLFFRYQYGLNDLLFQTYSGGYSFSFNL